jgi:hypothetical protein
MEKVLKLVGENKLFTLEITKEFTHDYNKMTELFKLLKANNSVKNIVITGNAFLSLN